MRLSDLEDKTFRSKEAQFNREQGTRSVELSKEDVVQALSRDRELAKRKIDELPERVRKELNLFFSKEFWKKQEASNG